LFERNIGDIGLVENERMTSIEARYGNE